MSQPIFIRVRQASNTYAASHKGQRATATAGPHAAARQVAEKVYGASSFVLSDAGIDNSDNRKGAQHCFRVELKVTPETSLARRDAEVRGKALREVAAHIYNGEMTPSDLAKWCLKQDQNARRQAEET